MPDRRRGRAVALKTLEDLDQSPTTIERVSIADERRAREILVPTILKQRYHETSADRF